MEGRRSEVGQRESLVSEIDEMTFFTFTLVKTSKIN